MKISHGLCCFAEVAAEKLQVHNKENEEICKQDDHPEGNNSHDCILNRLTLLVIPTVESFESVGGVVERCAYDDGEEQHDAPNCLPDVECSRVLNGSLVCHCLFLLKMFPFCVWIHFNIGGI